MQPWEKFEKYIKGSQMQPWEKFEKYIKGLESKLRSARILRLYKICVNTGFQWPVFSYIRTESQIRSLHRRIRASENPYSRTFYVVQLHPFPQLLETWWTVLETNIDIFAVKGRHSIHSEINFKCCLDVLVAGAWTWSQVEKQFYGQKKRPKIFTLP